MDATDVGLCPVCKTPRVVRISRTAAHPNKPFKTCPNRCKGSFEWVDNNIQYTDSRWMPSQVPLPRSTDDSPNSINQPTRKRESQGLSSVERGGGTDTGAPQTPPGSQAFERREAVGWSREPSETGTQSPFPPSSAGSSPLSFLSKTPSTVRLAADSGESDIAPAGVTPQFVPSKYQSAIYDFLRTGAGNGVVIATAGSGKTSTIRNATPYLPKGAKVAAIAFNRRNALDLQRVMPEWVRASTFHSLGLGNLKRANKGVKVDEDKVWNILRGIERQGGPLSVAISEDGAAIRQVVSLVKSTLSPTDDQSLSGMVEHYGIPLNGNTDAALDIVRRVMDESDRMADVVDFGDMLYRCANGSVPCERFDFILQDEAQDATQAQIEFVKRSLKADGRLLAVGDPRQAIYSWAGSAIDSIDQLTRYHHASTLPLSITYRLPLSHVEKVNRRFPTVGMEARQDAPDGVIGDRTYPAMIDSLRDGDLVICRVNAPLIEPCFELIRQGRKATIAGRDIGKGLTTLLTKMERRNAGASIGQLMTALLMYAERECDKLVRSRKANQAATLRDQVDTLVALSDGVHTTADIRRKVAEVFSDDVRGVTFSSCHRAKGAEAETVYLYKPELIPHKMASGSEWQMAAEENVLFVSWTRSKSELYFVSGD